MTRTFLIFIIAAFGFLVARGQSTSPAAPSSESSREAIQTKSVEASLRTEQIQTVASDGVTPVPFAVVLNKRTGAQAATDLQGRLTLIRNPQLDTVLIRSVGFMDMVIYPGDAIPRRVRMVEDLVNLEVANVITQGIQDENAVALSSQVSRISSIQKEVVKLEVPQTAAELLWSTGSVLIQQSQQGGGSPILRGFEANRVLLVVDGVRMNNAIYRSGHLQNAITVDPFILQRTDVLLGPNSVLFGSDAMGGVIHYHTRTPQLGSNRVKAAVAAAYRSPNQGYTVHADVECSTERFASLTSISHAEYGDLRMGQWRKHGNQSWGLDSLFVLSTDSGDVVVVNDDWNVQRASGYNQWDLLQKFRIRPGRGVLDLNFQWSESSNIPRYDVSNDFSGGQLKWAEWNYGPQMRALASAKYSETLTRWGLHWNTLVSYQQIEESRIKRRLGSDWREIQVEEVNVFNCFSTVQKSFRSGVQATFGMSGSWDAVNSTATNSNIHTLETQEAATRYPNGGSDMSNAALFASSSWNRGQHHLAGGIRWSRSTLSANFEEASGYLLPFSEVNTQNQALTGGVSDRWESRNAQWAATSSFSTGFRNPNVDDMGKVREKSGFVLVPNDSLRPEYLYSIEQAFHYDWRGKQILTLTWSGFASLLNDAIVPQLATLDGETHFWIDGDSARVQTNINASQATIAGMRVEWTAKLTSQMKLEGAVNWTTGRQYISASASTSEISAPMAHIPPIFGRLAMDYEGRWWTLESYVLFSGSKPEEAFGLFETDNLSMMLPSGAPSWWTLNLEGSAKLHDNLEWRLGVRNMLDMHYRVFASGISAPGRGLYTSFHAAF